MAEEKEIKKKASTKKKNTTTKKSSTTRKTTTKKTTRKTTTKKTPIKEEVIPYSEKVIPYYEKVIPYQEKVIPYEEQKEESPQVTVEKEDTTFVESTKPKTSFMIYLLVVLCLLLLIAVCIYAYLNPRNVNREGSFIEIGTYQHRIIYDNYKAVYDEDDLQELFPDKDILGTDFSKHDYVVIAINTNPCSESNFHPTGYYIEEDVIHVNIEYEASCGVCAPEYLYYLLELEDGENYNDVIVDYKAINNPNCDPMVAYKPIIYFYPTEKTDITVHLGNEEYLTTSYPIYKDSWQVTAYPDGTLKDNNGREYYGLFWEGDHHIAEVHDVGFVVKGEDTVSFLENKLKVLGLTDKEANEFIIYWYPKLKENAYNYIYFETLEEINHYMPLEVTPKPDSIIRIQMDYKPLDKPITVQEEMLTTPKRNGFHVVEWGGSIIKD